ncbi:MAG: hypothetical protein WD049_05610 [Candidatus Paceibacterota bacterium]
MPATLETHARDTKKKEEALLRGALFLQLTLAFGHHNIWYCKERNPGKVLTPSDLWHHFRDHYGTSVFREWFESLSEDQKWQAVQVAFSWRTLDCIMRCQNANILPDSIRSRERQLYELMDDGQLPRLKT